MRAGLFIVAALVIIVVLGVGAVAAVAGDPVLGVDFVTMSTGGTGTGTSAGGTSTSWPSSPDPVSATFSCPDCKWFLWADSPSLQKIPPSGVTIDEFYSSTIIGRRYTSILGQWYVWTVYHGPETHTCDPNDPVTPLSDPNPSNPSHWGCPMKYGQEITIEGVAQTVKDTHVIWSRPEWYETHTQGVPPPGVTDGLKSLLVAEVTNGGLTGAFYDYRYSYQQCQEFLAGTLTTQVVINGAGDHGGKAITIDTTYCNNPPYSLPFPDGFASYNEGTEAQVNTVIGMLANSSTDMKNSENYFNDGFHYSYDSVKASCQGWFLPWAASLGCYTSGSQQTHIVISLIQSTVAAGWTNPSPVSTVWFDGTVTTGSTLLAVLSIPCGNVAADEVAGVVTYVYKCQLSTLPDVTYSTGTETGMPTGPEPGKTYGGTTTIEDTEMVAGTWLPTNTTEQHYSDSDLASLKTYMTGLSWTDRIVFARVWTYLSYQNVDCVKYGLTGKFSSFLSSGNPNDLWNAQFGIPPLYCEMANEHNWSSSYAQAECSTGDYAGVSGAASEWSMVCDSSSAGCTYAQSNSEKKRDADLYAKIGAKLFTQVTYDSARGIWVAQDYISYVSPTGTPVIVANGMQTDIGTTCLYNGGTCPNGIPGQEGWVSTDSQGHTITTGGPYWVFTILLASKTTVPLNEVSAVSTLAPYSTEVITVYPPTVSTIQEIRTVTLTNAQGSSTGVRTQTIYPGAVTTYGVTVPGVITIGTPEGGRQASSPESRIRSFTKAGMAGSNAFSLLGLPNVLLPVASDTNLLHDYRLYYDMSTGTFVAVDVGGTYPLLALSPDNPRMYGGLDLPSAPHFGLTDQWPYVSVQASSQTTVYVYWIWVPFIVLCPILLGVGLLLRRHDKKDKDL